ncbi:hypothetical protein [Paenibacillus mendelii]|uniref:Lipoprotein n=1 Tax=Paenibacillus mendelii TaxID=206163 RepID=A0ABV6JFJ9_9BACL|nr:hypothetical protein [Paenibacillus mendelii]MCQ6557545.1 hypothetical protein [Paenibacillus mendelii]
MKGKLLFALTLVIVLLCGCSQNPFTGKASIEWIDFVKMNGKMYTGFRENVVKNPDDVTDVVVGEVKFNVSNVSNPKYRTKSGDSSSLEKGSRLYRVKGFKETDLIAAEDRKHIGGYRLFAGKDFESNLGLHYQDMLKKKVIRLDLHKENEVKPYKSLTGSEMDRFIQLLNSGTDQADMNPAIKVVFQSAISWYSIQMVPSRTRTG